jgi:hypothetical protein
MNNCDSLPYTFYPKDKLTNQFNWTFFVKTEQDHFSIVLVAKACHFKGGYKPGASGSCL